MEAPKYEIMGGEKLMPEKPNQVDNLQTRMERWEEANNRLMKDLPPEEWIRVVNCIGCMTESEAEQLLYSLQGGL